MVVARICFAVVRVAYGDDSEIVAIVDGGCTHLLMVLIAAKDDNSDSVVKFDGGCTHLVVVVIIAYGMIVRVLLMLMVVACICL